MNEDKENLEIMEFCSKCFKEHGNKCIAEGLSCEMGLTHSLEDYKTEYELYDKAIRTDNLNVMQNNKIIPLSQHKHELAFNLAYPLEDGFVRKEKICSICRKGYEVSIYRDFNEFERLNEKLKHGVI